MEREREERGVFVRPRFLTVVLDSRVNEIFCVKTEDSCMDVTQTLSNS